MPNPNSLTSDLPERGAASSPAWVKEEIARRKAAALAASAEETVLAGRARRSGSGFNYVTEEMLPTNPDHEKARIAAENMKKRGKGWKLHLNFDPDNKFNVWRIENFLETLEIQGKISAFKIGHGGGKADGAPGKEATVYVGAKDDATELAKIIEERLSPELLIPEGDTLEDDIPFSDKVMGRFELVKFDPDFHQYGKEGVPFLIEDVARAQIARLTGETYSSDEARLRADYILRKRYETFYTGAK